MQRKTRCVVLGGGGFIGSHLTSWLLSQNHSVRIFDLPGRATPMVNEAVGHLEIQTGDFLRQADVRRAVEGCEAVFHLIGTTVPSTSNRNPVFDVESNVVGTIQVLKACVAAGVKRIIFSSSGGTVYGTAQTDRISELHPTDPRSSYGITKLACEKYLALFQYLHGLDYTVLRIGNAYGPRLPTEGEQGVVGVFLACLQRGKPIVLWGDGSIRRDYVYVDDVVRAFGLALEHSSSFRLFNIGTGIGTSLNELIAKMEQVTGKRAVVERRAARASDVPTNVLDSARAQEHLGWMASTTLADGLGRTWEWICQAV